jgi:hypothetical protein
LIFDASKFSEAVRESVAIIRLDLRGFAVVFAVLFTAGTAFDYGSSVNFSGLAGFNLLYGIVAICAQAWVTRRSLRLVGITPMADGLRIWAFVGMGILSGLGIIVGTIALILPGIYLAGRWYLAAPFLLADNVSATDALTRSWHATERDWLAASLLAVCIVTVQLAPIIVSELVRGVLPLSWPMIIAVNLVAEAAHLFAFVAPVALYNIIVQQRRPSDAEVFS